MERRNRTLVEAARTTLIFSCASLFLWAEEIATACYTQNHYIIYRRFNKTPYELINCRKLDISVLHVFRALCYPKNDREDLGKLGAKGDIGFFIGYSANSCAYRVYNRRTKKIMEMMNITFDELSAMDFEQRSSKPGLQDTTPTTTNSSSQAADILNTSQDVDELEPQQQHVQQQVDQASLQPETVADNVSNAMLDGNTFANPFATPSTYSDESSSHYVSTDSSYRPFHSERRIDFYSLNNETISRTMAKPILNEARAEHSLAETSIESNAKYELKEELLNELRSNTYRGKVEEDVVGHIAKILDLFDPIEVTGMDPFQLRMKTFPLSLSRKARKWWMNEGDGKINTWEELVNKFYPLSCDSNYDKMCEDDEEGLNPLEFITWRNSKLQTDTKADETTKHNNYIFLIEVGNNEGLMDEDISSDDDKDQSNSSMITKPEIKIGDEILKILTLLMAWTKLTLPTALQKCFTNTE
ncbi:retrovirus-related pol polyprotein from transposon TNT 1-94 [Tanacetum coccineum]|uniref:Retrovirus-related pol polyprotein from transposon TNT 1-94 n=1 Tax=Tanacetum coccineum TaxID=301880 RepID=A0ABQ5JEE8_9ASTR